MQGTPTHQYERQRALGKTMERLAGHGRFRGQIAAVTGGGGIGKACAEQMAPEGATVVLLKVDAAWKTMNN